MQEAEFDLRLAKECARAFSEASGLGCLVSDSAGRMLAEYGAGCESCRMCAAAGRFQSGCVEAHIYGMSEAERFGGKYIYYCPMGLTCFVSPILGEVKSAAKITVGPFLMVEKQDFIDCELSGLEGERRAAALAELERVPLAPAGKVTHLATLLFMAVGFMNNVSAANRQLRTESATAIQGQVTEYIVELKNQKAAPYPIEKENALLRAIRKGERAEAGRFLNELLGHIFFSSGTSGPVVKSRIYELLVLIGRAAIDSGANAEAILAASEDCLRRLPAMEETEEICLWLRDTANEFMDAVFAFSDARHANAIHRCVQYIETHYPEKVSLEQLARTAYLSAPYLSRVFKQETGLPFNVYLNKVRIDKSKDLLLKGGLRLADIAAAVCFEDQSYYTKVFKRFVGVPPHQYRASLAAKN